MSGCCFFITFVIFLSGPTFVKAIQKRYAETDVCYETKRSLARVNTCPKNGATFNMRLLEKKCDEYPKCQGRALFYHCVRENEHTLVEVCAPNQHILGGHCPVFEEKLGLVIEDYSSHCLECHGVYDSYNSSKYLECVQTREVSTYQTFTSKKVEDEADTSGSSLPLADTTVGTQTNENHNCSSYKTTNATQLREEENEHTMKIIGILSACFLLISFGIIICFCRKRQMATSFISDERSMNNELQKLNGSNSSSA